MAEKQFPSLGKIDTRFRATVKSSSLIPGALPAGLPLETRKGFLHHKVTIPEFTRQTTDGHTEIVPAREVTVVGLSKAAALRQVAESHGAKINIMRTVVSAPVSTLTLKPWFRQSVDPTDYRVELEQSGRDREVVLFRDGKEVDRTPVVTHLDTSAFPRRELQSVVGRTLKLQDDGSFTLNAKPSTSKQTGH